MKTLTFGAVLWDIIEGEEFLGGAPFNVAAHLAQCGADSYICTSVGADERGNRVLAEMNRLGVSPALVARDAEHPTGYVTVTLSAGGQPSYVIHENVAWDFISITDSGLDFIASLEFDGFCFGSLDQRSPDSRRSLFAILERLPNIPKMFDVNLRQHYFDGFLLRRSLEQATILKLNHDEVDVLSRLLFAETLSIEQFAPKIAKEYALATVVVTRGGEGCDVYHGGESRHVAGRAVKVADTVGAGDAFSAGFLYELCRGKSPFDAAELANELGAFVASQRGAIPSYSDELLRRIHG